MREYLKRNNLILLFFSIIVIYFLAPTLDRRYGVLVSSSFALINILSSHIIIRKWRIVEYISYLFISIGTYYILFNDQPWDLLFGGGMFDSSAVPLIVCSIIMSFNGWLLLHGWKNRITYLIITLALQIPFAIIVGTNVIQKILFEFSDFLHYVEYYSGSWQVWQFEWMLTYYLPIYFLAHKSKIHVSCKST